MASARQRRAESGRTSDQDGDNKQRVGEHDGMLGGQLDVELLVIMQLLHCSD